MCFPAPNPSDLWIVRFTDRRSEYRRQAGVPHLETMLAFFMWVGSPPEWNSVSAVNFWVRVRKCNFIRIFWTLLDFGSQWLGRMVLRILRHAIRNRSRGMSLFRDLHQNSSWGFQNLNGSQQNFSWDLQNFPVRVCRSCRHFLSMRGVGSGIPPSPGLAKSPSPWSTGDGLWRAAPSAHPLSFVASGASLMTAGWFLVFVWILGFPPAPQGFSDSMASRFPPTPRFPMAPSWSLLDHGFSLSDSWFELVGSWEESGGSPVAPLAPAALACLTFPPPSHCGLTLKFLFLFWLGFFWLFWVVSRELNQNFRPRTLQSELPPIWRWSQILWHWLQQKTVLNGRLWGLGPARIRLAWEGFRRVFARTGEILRVNRDPGVHRASRQNEPITSAAGGHLPATRDWPGHDAQWNPDDGLAIASRGRGGAGDPHHPPSWLITP